MTGAREIDGAALGDSFCDVGRGDTLTLGVDDGFRVVRGSSIDSICSDDDMNEGRKECKIIDSEGLKIVSPGRMTGDSVGFKVAQSTDVLRSLPYGKAIGASHALQVFGHP
jgi:hypothetical protein